MRGRRKIGALAQRVNTLANTEGIQGQRLPQP